MKYWGSNGEDLVSPPQVAPELIPVLDVSYDDNFSEIMNEFDQNISSAEHYHQTIVSSEKTAVNLNPNAQFLNMNFTEAESFISNQENSSTVKKNSKRCLSCKKIPGNEKWNRSIHEILC